MSYLCAVVLFVIDNNNCVSESLFEMLNIHICSHCGTFLCEKTTCMSHVNGKAIKGYEREIQAVLNNRKN